MKKQLILTAALALAGFSVMAQGYVDLTTANNRLWDEFTSQGNGTKAVSDEDYAIYWAPVSTTDPLTAQGSQFGAGATTPSQQVATNGVSTVPANYASLNSILTGAGFTLGLVNGTSTIASGTVSTTGSAQYGQFQLNGTTLGGSYEMILVAWNSSASGGLSAIQSGGYADVGWSNPFNYTTGTGSTDPNGLTLLSSSGMNQFGVAQIVAVTPEPGTMALAGLGGLSLLVFRRKK